MKAKVPHCDGHARWQSQCVAAELRGSINFEMFDDKREISKQTIGYAEAVQCVLRIAM
jgi:hypothetical protein